MEQTNVLKTKQIFSSRINTFLHSAITQKAICVQSTQLSDMLQAKWSSGVMGKTPLRIVFQDETVKSLFLLGGPRN